MKGPRFLIVLALTLFLSLGLIPFALPVQPAEAAVSWAVHDGDLTINSHRIASAWVIKNGPGDYQMWYVHGTTSTDLSGILGGLSPLLSQQIFHDIASVDLEGLLNDLAALSGSPAIDSLWDLLDNSTSVIGYATSSNGIDWTVVNDEITGLNSGSTFWDGVSAPSVVKTGSSYQMWYTHPSTSLTKTDFNSYLADLDDSDPAVVKAAILALLDSTSSVIGYATSDDARAWTPVAPDVVDATGSGIWKSVAAPSVIRNSDTDYQMWFTNAATDFTDANLDTVLADPAAFDINDLKGILDETSTTIGYATSSDGQTWAVQDASVLAGSSGGIWDSVSTPSVVKTAPDSYEMWFTRAKTDLTSANIQTLFDDFVALEPELTILRNYYDPGNLTPFITEFTDFIDNDIADIEALLAGTGSVIAYATSTDGANWTVEQNTSLGRVGPGPWGSVASPCVVYSSGLYEMWYAKGTDNLTAQYLLNLLQGTPDPGEFPIGYAASSVSINLVTGWNFVGLPVIPASNNVNDVLASIMGEVTIVWYYDGTTPWKYFIPGGSATLTEMTERKAYWIQMTADNTLTIN